MDGRQVERDIERGECKKMKQMGKNKIEQGNEEEMGNSTFI